jgi:oxygen-independent coproporphyrinogen-3 oxidase
VSDLGVYIHFPWCRKLCPYCDFAVAVCGDREPPHQAYLDAVLDELTERSGAFAGRRLVSIYFGGGTPSLWDSECLGEAVAAAKAAFPDRASSIEVTLEANPNDCTAAAAAGWLSVGINRLSLGTQAFDAPRLATLGREHSAGESRHAVAVALEAGFDSVSADEILGVPDPTARDGCVDPGVIAASDTGCEHLSVYELTIEERTRFGRDAARGVFTPLDSDVLADMYTTAHIALCERGFEHYEISSYARPGRRAVHNSLYWRGAEYLGIGNSAASFRLTSDGGGIRETNLRAAKPYMRSSGIERVAETERLSRHAVATDRIWLGMRTVDGVAETAFEGREQVADDLVRDGLAERRNGRIQPTLRGFLQADGIARRVVAATG